MVVQGCQKLVLILLKAWRTKANNTSVTGGVHLIIVTYHLLTAPFCMFSDIWSCALVSIRSKCFFSELLTCGLNFPYTITSCPKLGGQSVYISSDLVIWNRRRILDQKMNPDLPSTSAVYWFNCLTVCSNFFFSNKMCFHKQLQFAGEHSSHLNCLF